MYKIRSIIPVACAALFFSACTKATYLNVENTNVILPGTASEGTMILHSDGKDFELVYAPEWAGVTLVDSILSYNVAKNESGSSRYAGIVVATGELQLEINLTQCLPATYLELDEETVRVTNNSCTVEVGFETDGTGVTAEGFDEVTAECVGDKVIIHAPKHEGEAKTGIVTVKCGECAAALSVTLVGDACPKCDGSGEVPCPKCHGEGVYTDKKRDGIEFFCDECGGIGLPTSSTVGMFATHPEGSGRITCPKCHGKGL